MTTIYHNDNSISMTTHLPPPATILHTILHTILQSTGRHPHHLLPPATINRQPSSSSWHLSSPSDYTSHVAITPRRGILLLSWESICSSDYTMRHCSRRRKIRAQSRRHLARAGTVLFFIFFITIVEILMKSFSSIYT